MKGLAVIVLDALDIDLIRAFDLDFAHDLYMENGNLLTCSVFPHTQSSNILIWSGEYRQFFWCRNESNQWIDPARNEMKYRKSEPQPTEDSFTDAIVQDREVSLITYEDVKESGVEFIWEVAEENGLNARAVQIPVTLPPYSYNAKGETEAWFPYLPEYVEENRRDKHKITMNALEEMAEGELDFYCTSFVSPDKPIHGPAMGHCTEEWSEKEIKKLDTIVKDIHEFCEENDIGYVILGDHGAPGPDGPNFGEFPEQKIKVVRHRKHSVIFGNIEPLPHYTHEMFGWMVHQLNVEVD